MLDTTADTEVTQLPSDFGQALAKGDIARATMPAPLRLFRTTAVGATLSPSPGTSRAARAAPKSPKDPRPWVGEQRNMWKPTKQQVLRFLGGNLHQSRHHSQFLALQVKARMEGIAGQVYGLPETHHLG